VQTEAKEEEKAAMPKWRKHASNVIRETILDALLGLWLERPPHVPLLVDGIAVLNTVSSS
jgi:hypothetical protein